MKQAMNTINATFGPLAIVFVAALLAACGPGNGQGLDEDGNLITLPPDGGTGNGGGASGNPDATLSWLQSNIFGGVCTQCHTGAGAPLGVNWSSSTDSCSNIGRASGEFPMMDEIVSGDAAASYVIWKVDGAGPNGEAIVGAQMPLSNPPLTVDAIQNMRDWINDGTPGCATQSATASISAPQKPAASNTPGTWQYVWHESLQLCSTCHSIAPTNPACLSELQCPPNGLVLSADNYYGIVDGYTVVPFDPDRSRLWKRLTQTDPEHRMPHGLAPLSQRQQDIIFDWIVDGAPGRAITSEVR